MKKIMTFDCHEALMLNPKSEKGIAFRLSHNLAQAHNAGVRAVKDAIQDAEVPKDQADG